MSAKKRFAVLGLGRFGKNLALTLEEMGCEVLGVDKDENIVANLVENLTKAVIFDIRDANALKEVGISEFDTVIIASKNLEASLMATMLCKEFNVAKIIVKAIDERHAVMAERLGADRVIFSERDTARSLAMNLISQDTINYIDIDADINGLSLNVPKKLVGKNLIEANLRGKYDINIIAVISDGKTLVTPPPTHIFNPNDKIYIIGTLESLAKFRKAMIG